MGQSGRNPRLFRDGTAGPIYRVSLVLHERSDGLGVDRRQDAIVFEDVLTRQVLSAPIYHAWMLQDLTDAGLEQLLEQAPCRRRSRGPSLVFRIAVSRVTRGGSIPAARGQPREIANVVSRPNLVRESKSASEVTGIGCKRPGHHPAGRRVHWTSAKLSRWIVCAVSPIENAASASLSADSSGSFAPTLSARSRANRRETGTVIDNQGPAYLVRFDDGGEGWYDRPGVERDNPNAGEWA